MTTKYHLNIHVSGLRCLRCQTVYALAHPAVDAGQGCPACWQSGYPASLKIIYSTGNDPGTVAGLPLPFATFPSLGEGNTPLIPLPTLARQLNIAALWLKNEGQNPTGSHKDRMSPLAVARAASLGYKSVVAASSGNAGASLAAYAAAAGLDCTIISTHDIRPLWAQAIQVTGAHLILTETNAERWSLMREKIETAGYYPVTNFLTPPVGSNPFGVQGYKSVAFELVEQCGLERPSLILVPTARGDLLWGIWQGLLDMRQAGLWPAERALPRLIAVEPLPRLSRVLAGGDYRAQFPGSAPTMPSISGDTATYQSLLALQESGGTAVAASAEAAQKAQQALGQQGLFLEMSSAAALAALWQLAEAGQVTTADRVVMIGTSHGYKE